MKDRLTQDLHAIKRIAASIVRLWRTRDELSIRNIRKSHLCYFLPMVLVLTLLDQRNTYFHETSYSSIWGLNISMVNYGAFCLGSLFILLFFLKDFRYMPKLFSLIAIAGILFWLLLPDSDLRTVFLVLFQFGAGGCAIYAMYVYVFILCNAERLFGILLVTFHYGLFVYLKDQNIDNILVSAVIPLVWTVLLALCMFRFRTADLPESNSGNASMPPRGIYVVLACPFAFFVINIFGEAIVNGQSVGFGMRGLGALLAVVLSVLIQLVFQRSVWHMLNLFLILTIIGIALMALPLPASFFPGGALVFGIGDGIGYIMTFYLSGLLKRYRNDAFFRQITLATVAILLLAIFSSGALSEIRPEAIPAVSVVVAAFFFCMFLLFSPLMQRNIFTAEWMDDYRSADIASIVEQLDEQFPEHSPHTPDLFGEFMERVKTLTPTERVIFNYCIEERSNKEILSLMFISLSTLKTHNSHIYAKLNVSSRDELSLYIQLIKKSGRLSDLL